MADSDIFVDLVERGAPKMRAGGDSDIFADLKETPKAAPAPVAPPEFDLRSAILKNLTPWQMAASGMDAINQGIEKVAYNVGGRVTDAASNVLPAERTHPLQYAIPTSGEVGYLANVGTQALPTLLAGQAAQKLMSPSFQSAAERLMRIALKPPLEANQKMMAPGVTKAQAAINTLLEQGVNPTSEGAATLEARRAALAAARAAEMEKSGATVNVRDAADYAANAMDKFKFTPIAEDAAGEIGKAQSKLVNHPEVAGRTDIPIQLAEELKQGWQATVAKKYGAPPAAPTLAEVETEAEKQIARGLRELQAKAAPKTAGSLSEEAKLINAKKLAERRGATSGNNQLGGIGWLNPGMLPFIIAERSPTLGGLMARMLYQGQNVLPLLGGGIGGIYTMAPHGVAPGDSPMLDLTGEGLLYSPPLRGAPGGRIGGGTR